MQSHSASVGQTAGVHIQQNSIGVNAVTGVQVPGNTVILKMNDIAPPISTVGKIKIKWIHMDKIICTCSIFKNFIHVSNATELPNGT